MTQVETPEQLQSSDGPDPDEDVVEGEAPSVAVAAADTGAEEDGDEAPITVGEAASEYFEWAEEKEQQRRKRNQKMGKAERAGEAFNDEARVAVARFVSHCGPQTLISLLTPHGMAAFQDTMGANAADVASRLHPVKDFLRYCWKQRQLTSDNLGNHLRVKRTVTRDDAAVEHEQAERFEVTAEGLAGMKADLERLQAEMPAYIQAVADAREDKDIRENAPLEAAREAQERLRGRIDELSYRIAHAVVSENVATGRAHVGSLVRVVRLGGAVERTEEYLLVGPTELGTTDVEVSARRISVESPVGRGLVDARAGAEVVIEAPRGTMRFRVESVQG